MTQKDQLKVMNAGFLIIRADMFRMQIKYKSRKKMDWSILEKDFKTKKALQERMKELLDETDIIED